MFLVSEDRAPAHNTGAQKPKTHDKLFMGLICNHKPGQKSPGHPWEKETLPVAAYKPATPPRRAATPCSAEKR